MTTDNNETLYALFAASYSLAAAYASRIADEVDAAHEDAPVTLRSTEYDARTVAPGVGS